MKLLSIPMAGIALSAFLASSCTSIPASPCGAAAAGSLLVLLPLVFISYLMKRKLTKHPMRVHNEEGAECHAQGQLRGPGSIGEEETVLAPAEVVLEPNPPSLAIDKCAGQDEAESGLTPDQTSEMSIHGSDSEDWGSLSSYSSDDEIEADGVIEISLPFHEGDRISLRQGIGHEEDDALNDNEEDSLLELDISAGFIKTNGEDEQTTSI